jgi:hypothetical protein
VQKMMKQLTKGGKKGRRGMQMPGLPGF